VGALAAEASRRVIPYHNRRWDGDFRTVAALVSSGRLGPVWRVESRFERWRPSSPPAPSGNPSWKEDPSQPGGGILYDLGTHLIDQIIVLFGSPSSVYAELTGRGGALDDDAFVALTYPAGPTVHLWASTKTAVLGPRFRLLGSARGYVKYGLDVQEEALRAGRSPTEPGWGEEPSEAWGRLGTVDGVESIPTLPGCYQQFYGELAACLLDGAEPPVRWEDAVAGLRVIEAARESAASGRVVTLGG
jgi:predicted dehydrogenase